MQCIKPITLRNGVFGCGKCIYCRIQKAREWSCRLLQELSYWEKSVFVTLTYSDKFLPDSHSLVKSDLQKFFKRLRKNSKAKLKYFACGEYGSKTNRPHYHAIIFGLGQSQEDKTLIKDCWRLCDWSMLQDKKAFGTVTYDSCRYVSDYIFKKYSGVKAEEEYISKGLAVPFKVSSLGLGLRYCLDNKENLVHNKQIFCRGVPMALPRYYADKLGVKLEEKNDLRFNQWTEYAKLKGISIGDVADVQLEHAKQREANFNRRSQLFRKGDL